MKALEKEEKERRITLSFCWSHVRRKFIEIEQNYPEACKEVLNLIGELFDLERGVDIARRNYER